MKTRLNVILLLIVAVPLGLIAWLGLKTARDEQERVQRQFREVLTGRLTDVREGISQLMARREREFLQICQLPLADAESIREVVTANRFVRQIFVLDAAGRMIHPPLQEGAMTRSESEFIVRTRSVWSSGAGFRPAAEEPGSPGESHGWRTWFWGEGVNIIFWRRNAEGRITGVELDRVTLMADIIAALPASDPATPRNGTEGRLAISEAGGKIIYQWGSAPGGGAEVPAVRLALEPPLATWTLEYFAPAAMAGGWRSGAAFNTAVGLVLAGAALVGLAVYFHRESSREIREAGQRVSFVNQVSHEFKTPLTNIRMYGELLQQELPEGHDQAQKHVEVVISETQRLGRLVENVLAFARKQKSGLRLSPSPGIVDDIVASALETFAPVLGRKGIEVTFREGAPRTVRVDADVLGQILGNLFSNVEKYAAGGHRMEIASWQDGDRTVVKVADQGPGIPAGMAGEIFKPFVRLSNRLTDGATGTGIGLSIARDLARLHGGDLVLMPTEKGATFEVRLHTQPADRDRGEVQG